MAIKVYKIPQLSKDFKYVLPSGLDTLTGSSSFTLTIRKPDLTTLTKSITGADIVANTLNINVSFVTGDLSQEGIYDYEFTDTTTSSHKKGKTLQFTVTESFTN